MLLTLYRVNQFLYVKNWQSWMEGCLTFTLLDTSPAKDDNGKLVTSPRKYNKACYYRDEGEAGGMFLAGLLEEFKASAERHGYEVEVQDLRDPNPMLIPPDIEHLHAEFRYKQPEVLNAIIQNDKGIITCSTGFGKSFIIKTLCQLYPNAKIVVCTAARSVVDQLYKNISQLVGKGAVGKLCAGTPSCEDDKRVQVSTMRSLMRANLENCDFLLFDEVHNVGDNQAFEELRSRCGGCRMFGFTASLARGDKAIPLIKALFGKVVATCTYQEAAEHKMVTPIKAMFLKYDHRPKTKMTDMQFINERIHYWQNRERNAFIGKITADIPPEDQTLITVSKLEHAIFLKQVPELADWPIIHSGDVKKGDEKWLPLSPETVGNCVYASLEPVTKRHTVLTPVDGGFTDDTGKFVSYLQALAYTHACTGNPIGVKSHEKVIIAGHDVEEFRLTPGKVKALIEDFSTGKIKKAISTSVIKEGVDLWQLRFLIRADGTSSEVFNTQVPGRLSRLYDGKDLTVLIDIWDDDNSWVRGRSEARKKIYKKHGWLE